MVASDTRILLVNVRLKCFKCHLLRSREHYEYNGETTKKVSNELNITSDNLAMTSIGNIQLRVHLMCVFYS